MSSERGPARTFVEQHGFVVQRDEGNLRPGDAQHVDGLVSNVLRVARLHAVPGKVAAGVCCIFDGEQTDLLFVK